MTTRTHAPVPPGEGEALGWGGFGVVYKISGAVTGGAFAIVEHPMQPGVLAAPPHTHTREDEITLVLEGEVGLQIGDDVFVAGPGTYVVKPRGVPHTFWNAGSVPARIQEIITPAGFENYFRELAEILAASNPPDLEKIGALAARYGLTFHMERLEETLRTHGVGLM
ncbi:MAG TPA: cupin domain-containing protein [Thermomicrobiales bacterium]|nr:cupin domain-containing protein [Thermomicrobiales bacterium]